MGMWRHKSHPACGASSRYLGDISLLLKFGWISGCFPSTSWSITSENFQFRWFHPMSVWAVTLPIFNSGLVLDFLVSNSPRTYAGEYLSEQIGYLASAFCVYVGDSIVRLGGVITAPTVIQLVRRLQLSLMRLDLLLAQSDREELLPINHFLGRRCLRRAWKIYAGLAITIIFTTLYMVYRFLRYALLYPGSVSQEFNTLITSTKSETAVICAIFLTDWAVLTSGIYSQCFVILFGLKLANMHKLFCKLLLHVYFPQITTRYDSAKKLNTYQTASLMALTKYQCDLQRLRKGKTGQVATTEAFTLAYPRRPVSGFESNRGGILNSKTHEPAGDGGEGMIPKLTGEFQECFLELQQIFKCYENYAGWAAFALIVAATVDIIQAICIVLFRGSHGFKHDSISSFLRTGACIVTILTLAHLGSFIRVQMQTQKDTLRNHLLSTTLNQSNTMDSLNFSKVWSTVMTYLIFMFQLKQTEQSQKGNS